MSGFEVVGVVLGAIPLLVTALEHYSDGVSTMRNMWDYESVFENLHASLVTSLLIYKHSCEQLLGPLMLPESKLYELLEKLEGNAWQDAELGDSLRRRLGPSYSPYKASVKQLNKKIILFGKKLKLGEDLRPPWMTTSQTVDVELRNKFFKNPWTRIKGGFDTDKYARLLAAITSDVNQIATLTKGAITLEPLRLGRARRANGEYWISIQDQARRLFETFSSRWSCTCPCQHLHRANLRLDMRTEYEINNGVVFRFLFSFEPSKTVTVPLPWDWRDVEIEPLQMPNTLATNAPSSQYSGRNTGQVAATPRIASSPSPPFLTPSRQPSPTASRIANLCEVLGRKTQPLCCLGFLDDQPWQHHIYSVNAPSFENTARNSASLYEILHRGRATSLPTKEKCILALTLASAVLQLHDTPWLDKSWDLKDIYYINSKNENENRKSQGAALLGQPYVSKTFVSTSLSQQSTSLQSRCFVKNEMVFALGVALLELSYGEPISSFKTAQDLDEHGNETFYTEASIANRLVDGINTRELPNYARATVRCVRCAFDCFSCSLNDDEFRESFYEGVIVPLRNDFDYVTSTPPRF